MHLFLAGGEMEEEEGLEVVSIIWDGEVCQGLSLLLPPIPPDRTCDGHIGTCACLGQTMVQSQHNMLPWTQTERLPFEKRENENEGDEGGGVRYLNCGGG